METRLKQIKARNDLGVISDFEIVECILDEGSTVYMCLEIGTNKLHFIYPTSIREIIRFKEDPRDKAIADITNAVNNILGTPGADTQDSDTEDDDGNNLDWKEAEKYLYTMKKAYEELGAPAVFALNISIRPLVERFEQGERTKWLYNAINELQ